MSEEYILNKDYQGNPISSFVALTKDGFDDRNPSHLSALARLTMAFSDADCADMGALIISKLKKAGGINIPYDQIRAQFSHGGEAED